MSSRERYYELFKATHFFAALVFVIFFFLHCDHILTSWDYFIAAAVLYSLTWLYSQLRTYLEHGVRHRASLAMETGDTIRITVDTDAKWNPGQHIFLRFLTQGVHALTAHPFTICSLDRRDGGGDGAQMVFHIRARGGLTKRLAALADKDPGVSVPVLLDGPYGGVKGRYFDGFDHAVVIGGGAGAGFTLGLAKHFLSQARLNAAENRRMTLLVSSRDPELHQWFLASLAEALPVVEDAGAGGDRPDTGLSVVIHDTSRAEPVEQGDKASSNSGDEAPAPEKSGETRITGMGGVQATLVRGRADLFALGREVTSAEGASVGIVVCGPASMIQDASMVAASAQGRIIKGGPGASEVWFHKESFS